MSVLTLANLMNSLPTGVNAVSPFHVMVIAFVRAGFG